MLTVAVAFELLVGCANKGCGEQDAVEDAGALVGKRGPARGTAHDERAVLPRLLLLLLLVRVLHGKAAARALVVAVPVHSRKTEAVVHTHRNRKKKGLKREKRGKRA